MAHSSNQDDEKSPGWLRELIEMKHVGYKITLVSLISRDGDFATKIEVVKTKFAAPLDTGDEYLCGVEPTISGLTKKPQICPRG